MKNILIVAPHPDDEIVGLGITIKKLLMKKKKVTIFFSSNGVISQNQQWLWKKNQYANIVLTRKKEMKESLNFLGVENFYFQNIPTRKLKENRRKHEVLIRN